MDSVALARILRVVVSFFAFVLSAAAYAQSAGTIQFVAGDVKVRTAGGLERTAQKGDTVQQGDTILTGGGTSSAQLKMSDGGILAVRPNSHLTLNQYLFSGKEDGSERAVMTLLRGGFRTITGLIGRRNHDNYIIATPTATIGIRGTDHEVVHVPSPTDKPPSPKIGLEHFPAPSFEMPTDNVPTLERLAQVGTPTNDADVPFLIVQAGPQPGPGTPGTGNKVNLGVTELRNLLGTLLLRANQAGFAPGNLPPFQVPPSLPIFTATPPVKVAGVPFKEPPAPPRAASGVDSTNPPADSNTPPPPAPQGVGGTCANPTLNAVGQQTCAPSLGGQGLTGPVVINLDTQIVTAGENGRFEYDLETRITTDTTTGATFPQPEVVVDGQLIIGDFGVLAAVAAANALGAFNDATASITSVNNFIVDASVAAKQTFGVGPAPTTAADSAISAAQTSVTGAGTQNTSTQGLSLTTQQGTASGNATSAAGLKSTAGTTQSSATSVYNANGSFRDSQAAPAKTAMDSAKSALDGADGQVQGAKTTVDAQVTALGNAKTASSSSLAAANSTLASAQTDLAAATTENNKIPSAQTVAGNAANNAFTQLAIATNAAGSGPTTLDGVPSPANSALAAGCGSAKACSDLAAAYAMEAAANQKMANFAQAQVEFNNASTAASRAASFQSTATAAKNAAQQEAAIAAAQLALAQNANAAAAAKVTSAVSLAGTSQTHAAAVGTQATNATNAVATAGTALSTSNTELATAQAQAAIVAQQAKIAQYNNPANATANQMGSLVTGIKRNAPADNQLVKGEAQGKANTDYVLDGQKSLVEMRSTPAQVTNHAPAAPGPDVNVKFSGGTAPEIYNSIDPVKGSIYYGRLAGAALDPLIVDINGTPHDLGIRSVHWIVGYQPATYYALTLGGTTTYTRHNSTAPTDASGNVGTLNSATLVANFNSQTVNASVNLSVAGRTFGMAANNMPIGQQNTFAASGLTPSCSGTGCGSYEGSLTGAFYRSDASAGGYGYEIHPTVAAGNPYSDLITGVAVFTTGTPPPPAPIIAEAQAARDAALTSYNAAVASLALVTTAHGNANTANTAAQVVTPVSLAAIDTSIGSAQTAVTTAATDNTSAQALSLTSTKATTDANATSAGSLKTAAATTQTSATTVHNANANVTGGVGGTDFRDATAITAKTAMDSAKTALDGADTQVQGAKTTVDGQVTALASAKTAAQSALTSANTSLTTAQTDRTSANTENGKIAPAQTAAGNALSTAGTQLTAAQNAAGSGPTPTDPNSLTTFPSAAASACASAKACSDLANQYLADATNALGTGNVPGAINARSNAQTAATRAATFQSSAAGTVTPAQSAATTAAAQRTIAENAAAAAAAKVATANTAATNAGNSAATASTQAGNAQTAVTNANTALATSNTQLSAINTAVTGHAAVVTQQAIVAQYNNPTIATPDRFTAIGAGAKRLAANSNERLENHTVDRPNTNLVLDGQKHLVESRVTDAVRLDANGTPTLNQLSADLVLAGGTTADGNVQFSNASGAERYVAIGRRTGGEVLSNGGQIVDLGTGAAARSYHWLIVYQPMPGYVSSAKLMGTTTYTRNANTTPTDTRGNLGTLNSATLAVNFDTMLVTAGVNVTIAAKTLAASAANIPFATAGSPQFAGAFQTVNCTGTCTEGPYAGNVNGTLGGALANAGAFVYSMWPNPGGDYPDLIQGAAGFLAATPPVLRPQPAANIVTSYVYGGGSTSSTAFEAAGTSYTLDGFGNVTQVADNPISDFVQGESVTGGTAQIGTPVTNGGTTITYGHRDGPGVSVSRSDESGSSVRAVDGSFHWIKGNPIGPFYLPMVLTTTATYTAQGGAVTDQSSAAGTIDMTSTLSINFNTQAVNADIKATTAAGAWRGFGNGIRLDGGQFFACKGCTQSPHNNIDVTFNGSSAGTFGNFSGALFGDGLNGAGVAFAYGQGTDRASGTVAMTAAAQSTAATYNVGVVAAGKLGAPRNAGNSANLNGTTTLASLDPELVNAVELVANASTRVARDGAATPQVVRFDGNVPVATPVACTNAGCTGVANTPATFTLRDTNFPLDTPPGPGQPASLTALADTGSHAATGITWGRYVGFISYVDRGVTNAGNPNVPSGAFDARTSNWHGMWTGNQSGPPVLPTGTITYTSVGGTLPTDSNGAVGTSTATLQANFTNMTVNTTVNATVGGNNWAATASNIPIQNAAHFQAQKINGAGNLGVTMNGSSANTAGKITGAFTGNVGVPGQAGAILGFSLNQGGAAGTTVQGTKAFQKP